MVFEKLKVKRTAKKNLKLMKSQKKRGGMDYLLVFESFGGNAGSVEDGRSCGAANFYFDASNGKIKHFDNPQYTPEEIRTAFAEGAYRVAREFDPQKEMFLKEIVGVFWWSKDMPTRLIEIEEAPVSELAKKVLKLSAELYNSKK